MRRLEFELRGHPDQDFVNYVWCGLHEGFDTFISQVSMPNKECKKILSARRNPIAVQELIELECKKGFLYGPFDKPPFESYRVSPLGLVIGKYSG